MSEPDRTSPPRSNTDTVYSVPGVKPVRVVAVGNIACGSGEQRTATGCQHRATPAWLSG